MHTLPEKQLVELIEQQLERRTETDHVEFKEAAGDRKSTRLNSSHQIISYAVFCLKKKKKKQRRAKCHKRIQRSLQERATPRRPHARKAPRLPLSRFSRLRLPTLTALYHTCWRSPH